MTLSCAAPKKRSDTACRSRAAQEHNTTKKPLGWAESRMQTEPGGTYYQELEPHLFGATRHLHHCMHEL